MLVHIEEVSGHLLFISYVDYQFEHGWLESQLWELGEENISLPEHLILSAQWLRT